MGVNSTRNLAAATNLRYSAFLGMLYVSTPESEAAIKEAKSLVGEAEVKKGFQGSKGDSSSAKAITFLREKGVGPVKVTGTLTSARVIDRENDGRKSSYLNVGVKDQDGRYYLSVDLGQGSAQMLARKLANAEIGVETEINMFATFGKREGASRAYGEHGASLKQRGVEVKGVDPQETLAPRVAAAMQALFDAGVSKDDKETLAKRRDKVELDFHVDIMSRVNDRFTVFYAQNGQQSPEADEQASMPSQAAA